MKFKFFQILLTTLLFFTFSISSIYALEKHYPGIAMPLPVFESDRAFKNIYAQVNMGGRYPSGIAHKKALDAFSDWFERCGADLNIQNFKATVSSNPDKLENIEKIKGYNIIAGFGPRGDATYILATHYDSRKWSDKNYSQDDKMTPTPGANENASGVAVLLEMARIFSLYPPPVPVDIVLFDLGVAGINKHAESWNAGAEYYAKHRPGTLPQTAFYLDMVGGNQAVFPKDYFSMTRASTWTDSTFYYAEKLDLDLFDKEKQSHFFCGHVPMLKHAIPTVFIGDPDYKLRFTTTDLAENCSPATLQQVGDLLVYIIYGHPYRQEVE